MKKRFTQGALALVLFHAVLVTAAWAWNDVFPDPFGTDTGSYALCDDESYVVDRQHASSVTFTPQQSWASGSVKTTGFDGDYFGVNLSIDTDGVAPGYYLVATVNYTNGGGYPDVINFYVTVD